MEGFLPNVLHSYKANEEKLIELITDCSQKTPAFKGTLQHLCAENFLIEDQYVDKDYLADYTNFYARCHRDYPRFCKRVHFFTKSESFSFTNDVLNILMTASTSDALISDIQNAYLGFIVLKPSKDEKYMIGTTCLSHYPNDESRNRIYTATRDYRVNLFGIPLSVASMAFQEQDETVAMCATIALWSAFSITGKKFQHRMPSPSEVTNLALSETSYTRDFPNEGLTPEQMGVAMAKLELKPLIIRTRSIRHLKALIYAYSKTGIPVVCGLSLYNEFKGKNAIDVESKSFHAVTINGFSFEGGKSDISFMDELRLVAGRMTQFYAHDDQLCPFTKMEFDKNFTHEGKTIFQKIKTTWQATTGDDALDYEEHKIAKVESLIIPLYHKIRISYFDILPQVQAAIKELTCKAQKVWENFVWPSFEWDIYLTEVSEFKRDILSKDAFPKKEEILQRSFAKYLWRSQAWAEYKDEKGNVIGKELMLEIVFDATDSKKRGISRSTIFYNKVLALLYDIKTS